MQRGRTNVTVILITKWDIRFRDTVADTSGGIVGIRDHVMDTYRNELKDIDGNCFFCKRAASETRCCCTDTKPECMCYTIWLSCEGCHKKAVTANVM